jgi:ribosomal protein L37AE/L43A
MGMYEPGQSREAWHLLRKVFLLLLVVTAAALGLVLLSRQKSNVPLLLFNVLADTSIGLLSGFGARFVLKGRHGLIRALAATAGSLVGLGVLGFFSAWRSGIGPFQAGWVPVHWLDAQHIRLYLPLELTHSPMNMLDLINAVVAIDTSWMALRVWRQGPRLNGRISSLPAQRVRRPARAVEPLEEHIEPVVVTPAVIPVPAPVRKRPASSSSAGSGSSGARIRRRNTSRNTERAVIARPASAIHPARSRTRHNSSPRRRVAVHLAVHEEHKCPYCFQTVTRNDPRGVVECPICHTLHHKDCWDITGNCQVPHLTTL